MERYNAIHIWNFPPNLTFIRLNDIFRKQLFNHIISEVGSPKRLIELINKSSFKYGVNRTSPSTGNFYSWINGKSLDRGKIKTINVPLWVLIEFCSCISNSKSERIMLMEALEKNIEYYSLSGKSNRVIKPKLPMLLTPEIVSVLFNFLGDGHIGARGVSSSYTQVNLIARSNFLLKLKNVFGDFEYDLKAFDNWHVIVPKIITEFYKYYFNLPCTDTFDAYIPNNIKMLDKEFLLAGLISFMVDEANIDETVTIYSKNKRLLEDIREISVKCGYICNPIREKYAHHKFDCYRFSISSESYMSLYMDICNLQEKFPLCGLAHKSEKLQILARRKLKPSVRQLNGITKDKLLTLLEMKPKNVSELSELLNQTPSSIREHLYHLEKDFKVNRAGRAGRTILWSVR